jgi:hypothetical protein
MVIVPEPCPNYDLSDLERSGEVVTLVETRLSPFRSTQMANRFADALRSVDFNSRDHFVCLTGRSASLSVFAATIAANYEGPFRVLIFDARSGRYVETKLSLTNGNSCNSSEAGDSSGDYHP